MRIYEIDSNNSVQLAALAQFLLGRARNTSARRSISTDAFIELARNLGVSLTIDQLMTLSQQPPLNGIIANINQQEVQFSDPDAPDESGTTNVNRDEQIVNKMAKRASKHTNSALK